MAKKQTAKERREAQWKKTLENRLKKSKKEDTYESMATVVQIDKKEEEEERAQLEEMENTMSDSKKLDFFETPNYSILKEVFPTDTEVKKMKNKLSKSQVQIAAEKIEDQEVLPLTDVILDENMADERQAIVAKMQKLLKRRYSLTAIADALQTNNYEKLDEVIEQRDFW
jgi:hypothetical protein